MVQLNDTQVDLLFDRILNDGVTDTDLQNDLLDHYCCFIEECISAGTDFDTAYNQAFVAITPNGMHEIQQELFLILLFKQTKTMKQIIYGSGFLASFGILTGIMFKSMHWPFGPIVLITGFVFLIVTAVALGINILKNRSANTTLYNVRVILGVVSAVLISMGGIFKVLSFPYGSLQLMVGMLLFNFVFLPMFFYFLYKQALRNPINA